ncbi:thioesterase family protein [Paraliobacillus salinarum]|uniref:thioesterase family protein n=1 Tax=Paraliobacillus salinarum TaxID=1158996 RepID=UPI0015F54491|nr:thioesterase family protein [Paraliobacillus salinarum]
MPSNTFQYNDVVQHEWVDYNGHMNDAAYAKVFSLAVDAFIEYIGLDEQTRNTLGYSIFTLETHICYLREVLENQPIQIRLQLLDCDQKRLHVFFEMQTEIDGASVVVATSEQMLMGMNMEEGRPSPFPQSVEKNISAIWNIHKHLKSPKQAGRKIGLS